MSFGFSVRVMVLFLALGHNTNALDTSGGSSGTRPLFAYPRSHKPAFVSTYEHSAQPGGFLGSSGSSHSGSGQVDGYSPFGSVSSYVPDSQILRKPKLSSQQPPKANPNANSVSWTNGGNWDLDSQNVKSIKSGIASSNAIIMQSVNVPNAFNPGYTQEQSRPEQLPNFNMGNLQTPHKPQALPTSNTGYLQRRPSPQQLPSFNTGYLQRLAKPQQLPTSNTAYVQKPPRPQELPTSEMAYPQKLPTANMGYLQKPSQELSTSNAGYLQKPARPQELPTSNTAYVQKPPRPQQLPTSNKGYLQKPSKELPTSSTGYLQRLPRPQQAASSNTGYLQKPSQELPTSSTGYLQRQPRPQQAHASNSAYQPKKPLESVPQTKAGMWKLFSDPNVQPANSKVDPGKSKPISMASPCQSRGQRPLVPM